MLQILTCLIIALEECYIFKILIESTGVCAQQLLCVVRREFY